MSHSKTYALIWKEYTFFDKGGYSLWPCSNWSLTQNLSSDPPYYGQLWYMAIEKLSVQYEWTTSHQRNLISFFWAEMAWCAFLRGPLSHVDDLWHPLLGVDSHEEELWIDSWLDGMMRLQLNPCSSTCCVLPVPSAIRCRYVWRPIIISRQAFTSNNLCGRCLYVISIVLYMLSATRVLFSTNTCIKRGSSNNIRFC